jgi:hypothetical protein
LRGELTGTKRAAELTAGALRELDEVICGAELLRLVECWRTPVQDVRDWRPAR